MDCGESDPFSQFMRHVTEDQRFQESIGDSRAPTVEMTASMSPQSFHMNDLMREIEHIEIQRMRMPPPPLSHIAVQNHSSVATIRTNKYQNQTQETFPPGIGQTSRHLGYGPNYENETYHFPAYELYDSQNFIENQHRANYIHMETQFESNSEGSRESSADLENTITIRNINDLINLNKSDENDTHSIEIQDTQLPEQNCNYEKETIPKFSNIIEFDRIMQKHVDDSRKINWNPQYPNQEMEITVRNILNPVVYSHIQNNPMRKELKLSKKGNEAFANGCYFKAELYFDAAVRKAKKNPENWYKLSNTLYMNYKYDKAISALKRYLRFKPNSFKGAYLQYVIYKVSNCQYQACQSVFNWLKNIKTYKHLIPPNFSMDDKNTTELDDEILSIVKTIFLKAARKRPTNNIDADLQIMIGNLYTISKDYDKVTDCKLTATNCSEKFSYELINVGTCLLFDENPYDALDYYLEGEAQPGSETTVYCKNIGYVYLYLKDFRKAINYFKKSLGSEGEKAEFQLQGNTLEDQYELCVRLYCAICNR